MVLSRSARRIFSLKGRFITLGHWRNHHSSAWNQPDGYSGYALLTGTDTDSLTILHVAYRVTLGIFQGDERDDQVALSLCSEVLVLGRDILEESWIIELHLVASLLEGNTEYLLVLDRSWHVVWINLDDAVGTLRFSFNTLIASGVKPGAITPSLTSRLMRRAVASCAYIAQGNKVTVRAHAVCTTSTNISASQRRSSKSTSSQK